MDRMPSRLENEVRREFSRLFEKNKSIEKIYKQIRLGSATFEQASLFAREVGTILASVFNELNLADAELYDLAYNIVGNAMAQNINLTHLVCESIQEDLNGKADIGLASVIPEIDQSKIEGIQKLIVEAKDEDALRTILDEPLITNAMASVDDWVRQNAEFQQKAGLSPVIVRKWSGRWPSHDTKHTDWCKSLEGIYEYRDTPSNVYRRHEGCRCQVLFYPSKEHKGNITSLAKNTKDVEGVLWNTGAEFSQSRNAVLRRRRKIYGYEEARKILNAEWKGGYNGNAERHF